MKYLLVMKGFRIATTLADDDQHCRPQSIGEYCGGCTQCLLMQANHYGMTIRKLEGLWVVYECVYYSVSNLYWKVKNWLTKNSPSCNCMYCRGPKACKCWFPDIPTRGPCMKCGGW
jgi:hypothetical protein